VLEAAMLKRTRVCRSPEEVAALLGTPQGRPRTDKRITASVQWAERIMEKIDGVFPNK